MDELDQAQVVSDRWLEKAMQAIKPVNFPEGECAYCSEPLESGHFCDAGCRDDYERMKKARSLRGG